ncbi:MAG: branched-chain amino acid ABC transporter substrate-binding protein [Pseudomonadota bacterium]
MRRLLLAIMVLALGLTLSAAGAASAATLKIGSLSPLTGPYAADGNDIKNGVETAIAVITAEGGLPGFDKIELSPQDTACDPRQAVAAANKLLNEKVTGVIGAYCSSSTIPASEVLAEEDIVQITPASTNPQVTERGLKYMFRMCGRDDDQGPAAVKFMSQHLQAKSVFIVDDKTTYSQGLADNVRENSVKAGLTVLAHEHVNQGDKDFSAILTKVKDAKPDAFYICLQNSATGSLMMIQAKRLGVQAAFLSQDAVFHPQLIEIGKDAAEGLYLTYGYQDAEKPEYKAFLAKYKENFGDPGSYSAYAYDGAMAYFKAVKAAGSTDPEKVRAEMMRLDYEGASKHVKFRENGDSGSEYIVYVVKDGAFKKFWDPASGKLY